MAWGDIVIAFLGGGAALILERGWERWQSTGDARDVARSLEREIEGHQYTTSSIGVMCREFRSTVFDNRYREIANLLPDDIVHDVTIYYSDMSHAWGLFTTQRTGWSFLQAYVGSAPARRQAILDSLQRFANGSRIRRFLPWVGNRSACLRPR